MANLNSKLSSSASRPSWPDQCRSHQSSSRARWWHYWSASAFGRSANAARTSSSGMPMVASRPFPFMQGEISHRLSCARLPATLASRFKNFSPRDSQRPSLGSDIGSRSSEGPVRSALKSSALWTASRGSPCCEFCCEFRAIVSSSLTLESRPRCPEHRVSATFCRNSTGHRLALGPEGRRFESARPDFGSRCSAGRSLGGLHLTAGPCANICANLPTCRRKS